MFTVSLNRQMRVVCLYLPVAREQSLAALPALAVAALALSFPLPALESAHEDTRFLDAITHTYIEPTATFRMTQHRQQICGQFPAFKYFTIK